VARVKQVNNSRKEHVCSKTGHVIPKGDSYLMAAPGFRAKPKYRCLAHPFRPSELTTSARSAPLAAIEAFEDQASSIETHEDLEGVWQDLVDALQEYVDEREQALEAWENGNSQLEDFLEVAQTALEEAEQHQIETFDEDEPQREDFKDTAKGQDKYDTAWSNWDEARLEHLSEQINEATEVAGSLEV